MDSRQQLRINKEYFGYLVGFPNGEIVLVGPDAELALRGEPTVADLAPYLLSELDVREGFHLTTPPLVWLEITRRCNLRCDHCYIDAGEARLDEMDSNRIHDLIDEFADMGVWAIAITGGEPTLHPEFPGFVQHARKRNLLVGIATNGMFLNDQILDAIPKDGVIISVSIDDLHIASGTRNREFTMATEAILRAQSKGLLTNIMTNTHRRNLGRLANLVDWAESHGVSVRSVPFSPLGRGKQHRYLENTVGDVDEAAKFWVRECEWEHQYHTAAGLCVGVIFNYGLSLAYMTRRCSSGRYLCYVCSDGTVYPCTMCAGEGILSPGSVRVGRFADLWQEPWEIRQLCWDNFRHACDGCVINDDSFYCASRCPAMSHARHGTLFSCGASDFEIMSTLKRTAMINGTPTGRSSGRPAVPKDRATNSAGHRISLPLL